MKKIAISMILGLFVVGCGGNSAPKMAPVPLVKVGEADASDYAGLIKQAKASNEMAMKSGHEWRDTAKFIKEAEAAKKAGDEDKAMKMAKKAKHEADNARAQAKMQEKAGPWLF